MKSHHILVAALATVFAGTSCTAMQNAVSKVKGNRPDALKEQAADFTTVGFTATTGTLTGEDINGEWQLATINSKNVTEEEDLPYIYFETSKGRFYAYNGCNTLNGSFRMTDGAISFGGVASTMKYCAVSPYEAEFNAAVNDESTLMTTPIYRIGADSYLTLTDKAGQAVMTLRKKNMEFLNGNWQITMADGIAVNDEEATVFFDIRELKLHGNTGCNFVNGNIYIDPQRPNAIDISNMGITRRGCPKTEQERAITVALESAYTATEGSEPDTAVLMDKSGKAIMTLKRTNAPVETE